MDGDTGSGRGLSLEARAGLALAPRPRPRPPPRTPRPRSGRPRPSARAASGPRTPALPGAHRPRGLPGLPAGTGRLLRPRRLPAPGPRESRSLVVGVSPLALLRRAGLLLARAAGHEPGAGARLLPAAAGPRLLGQLSSLWAVGAAVSPSEPGAPPGNCPARLPAGGTFHTPPGVRAAGRRAVCGPSLPRGGGAVGGSAFRPTGNSLRAAGVPRLAGRAGMDGGARHAAALARRPAASAVVRHRAAMQGERRHPPGAALPGPPAAAAEPSDPVYLPGDPGVGRGAAALGVLGRHDRLPGDARGGHGGRGPRQPREQLSPQRHRTRLRRLRALQPGDLPLEPGA